MVNHTLAIFVETKNGGLRLVKTGVTPREGFDYIWDTELNTEEHPIHIYNEETGDEIEW